MTANFEKDNQIPRYPYVFVYFNSVKFVSGRYAQKGRMAFTKRPLK